MRFRLASVSLAWNAVAGAASYNVHHNGDAVGSANSTSYTDSGLSAKTSYPYPIIAVNSSGESAKSQTIKASRQPPIGNRTVALDYAEGRITLAQFLQLGGEYGYNTWVTLYLCGSHWTDSTTCGPPH
jgi:hypothetical protein